MSLKNYERALLKFVPNACWNRHKKIKQFYLYHIN